MAPYLFMQFYFINYYSYESRKHDREEKQYSHYLEFDNNPIIYQDLININWGDGVTAYIKCINLPNDNMLGLGKNYLVVFNDNLTVHSRWYVMESGYTMKGQYSVTLRRDLIADHLDKVVSTKCMINRGWLLTGDKRLYKSEGFAFNQVKTEQILLGNSGADTVETPQAVVAYLAKNRQQPIDLQLTPSKFPVSYSANTLQDWSGYVYVTQQQKQYTAFRYNATVMKYTAPVVFDKFYWGSTAGPVKDIFGPSAGQYWATTKPIDATELMKDLGGDEFIASLDSLSRAAYPGGTNLDSYDNKYFYEQATGRYYLIHVNRQGKELEEPYETVNIGSLYTKCYTAFNTVSYLSPMDISSTSGDWFQIKKYYVYTTLELELVGSSDESSKITIPTNMCPTSNASYDIITIPCGKWTYMQNPSSFPMVNSSAIAQELAGQLGKQDSSLVYDVQLIPYMPQGSYTFVGGQFLFTQFPNTETTTYNVNIEDSTGLLRTFISAVQTADSSFEVYPIGATIKSPSDPIEFKVARETTMYRLCSPTYDSLYDFNPYDNNGLAEMRAYMTLKPFNPYLLIQPVFNESGLYGGNYKDNRGLICSNFSMTRTADAFLAYELRNSNYQQIFNRQVQSMDRMRGYAQTEAGWGIASSVLAGASTGAGAGAVTENPLGIGVSAVAGAVGGAITGSVDYNITMGRLNEQIALQKDMHYMNLGNVQALPDALTKVGAFTLRTAKQPFLEVYRATKEEQESLRKYITEQGMTYGDIDTMQTVIDNSPSNGYISGYAIYMNADFDAHEFNELNNELQIGVRWV